MLNPIQGSRPKRLQRLNVIGEQRQPDWKHPHTRDRQKPEDAANGQQ
jgi:hypothetical protein